MATSGSCITSFPIRTLKSRWGLAAVNPNLIDHTAADLRARLGRYVRRRVGHPPDAEDVLQDIFVRLLGSDGPNEASKLLPWAFSVARNRVIDFYRERGRQLAWADGAVESDGPERDETRLDLRDALTSLMSRLPEHDQEALRMVDLGGMSQKDYARSLGLRYVTAKSRVQRARKRLRREFERCCALVLDGRGAPLECNPRHESNCCDGC